jgi:hypothetical protein
MMIISRTLLLFLDTVPLLELVELELLLYGAEPDDSIVDVEFDGNTVEFDVNIEFDDEVVVGAVTDVVFEDMGNIVDIEDLVVLYVIL